MNFFATLFGFGNQTAMDSVPAQASGEPWRNKVLAQLSNQEISAREIIGILSENPKLKMYYTKSAGVIEGYTVGQHSEMVLEIVQRYREYFMPLVSDYLQWGEFLLFLALHDIGKGVSKEADCIASHRSTSAKELELLMTRNILTETLENLGARSRIGHIFQAMLMYDSQGDYLKGDIDADCFKKHLLDMSAVSGHTPKQFYQLYNIFHLVDAASYPNLRHLFIFDSESLRHCEGNQLAIDYLYELLG